jgi:hypothetical protein
MSIKHDQPTVIVDSGASHVPEFGNLIKELLLENAYLKERIRHLESQIYGGTSK